MVFGVEHTGVFFLQSRRGDLQLLAWGSARDLTRPLLTAVKMSIFSKNLLTANKVAF